MGDSEDTTTFPVQTVRKISVDNSGIQVIKPQSENTDIVSAKQSSKAISGLISESNIARNDSYSKFGHLETVSLDLGEQTELQPPEHVAITISDDVLNVASQHNTGKQSEASDSASLSLGKYSGSANTNQQVPFNEDIHISDSIINSSNTSAQPTSQINDPLKSNTLEKVQDDFSSSPLKPCVEDTSKIDKSDEEIFKKMAANSGQILHPANIAHNEHSVFASHTLPHIDEISSLTSGSENISEAWILSEKTSQTLHMLMTSPPGTFFPEKHQLTIPSIIIEEEMDDPIKLLLQEINPSQAQERKVLTADDVPQNEEGLKKLIKNNCYHAAINLIGRLLKNLAKASNGVFTNHSPFSLKLWFIRIALFVKLRKFSYAEVESGAFGDFDRPDLYFEFYPDLYHGKKGPMVPFSFRLLLAELPQYQGNHQIALNNLFGLLHVIQKMIENLKAGHAEDGSITERTDSQQKASLDLWHQHECKVLYSILNCFFSQKDYITLVSIIRILLKKDKEHTAQLYSALGRIYLQLGDMKQARNCFNLAAAEAEKMQDEGQEVEKLINKALLSITHNENEEAYKTYEQALQIQPDNPMLVNNMAVCLLYMGRLKESLTLLEKSIQKNPVVCLHDGILFNLCTLYELESSHCTVKKQAMLNLVAKYAGDNFMVSCLKIPPNVKM